MNTNLKEKQEIQVLQIQMYQDDFRLSDKEMAERIGISEERYQEIMEDCSNITLDELMKISFAIDVCPTKLLINLTVSNAYLNSFNLKNLERILKKYGSKAAAISIANEINQGRIIIMDEELYSVGRNRRLREKLSLDLRKKLVEICIKENFIEAASFLSYNENILNITSLKDLSFLTEAEKNIFLYGRGYQRKTFYSSLPSYFDKIAESVSKSERLEMYQNAKDMYIEERNIMIEKTKSFNDLFKPDLEEIDELIEDLDRKIKMLD